MTLRATVTELRLVPAGIRLAELPHLLDTLPRLSPEEAASFGADIDAARTALAEAGTPNVREFARVPGLAVEDWTRPA